MNYFVNQVKCMSLLKFRVDSIKPFKDEIEDVADRNTGKTIIVGLRMILSSRVSNLLEKTPLKEKFLTGQGKS